MFRNVSESNSSIYNRGDPDEKYHSEERIARTGGITILAIFAFSYLIIKKLNRLLNENRHWISAAETGDCSTIRISAESPNLLNSIEPFFTSYSDTHPHIVIRFGYGNAQALLKKLTRGSLHIILLSEKPAKSNHMPQISVIPAPS